MTTIPGDSVLRLQQYHHALCNVQAAIREMQHAARAVRGYDTDMAAVCWAQAKAMGPLEWSIRGTYLRMRDRIGDTADHRVQTCSREATNDKGTP